MNGIIKKLAQESGLVIFECEKGWGGKYGYYTLDSPNWRFCGYKNKREIYIAWLEDNFASDLGKAVLKRLGILVG